MECSYKSTNYIKTKSDYQPEGSCFDREYLCKESEIKMSY